ncbi:MAG: TadB-related pilus assembly protein [Caulobacteraceae bacterium]|nr:TadB-related pilus assembly protein [Caulobacteraceae bacterium]
MGDMLLILVGLLAFVSVAGVGLVVGGASNGAGAARKRAQTIVQRGRGDRVQRQPGRAQADAGQRRKQILRTLQEQEKKRRAAAFDATAKLRQAGLTLSAKAFWLGSGGLGLVVATLALVLHMKLVMALMMGFVGGAGVPLWFIGALAKRRSARFGSSFPDAVDIIVRGLRSGLPLHDCLKVIGKECPEPLAGEFRRLVEGVAMGVTLEQGLDRMHERMPTPELRFFAIVLNIQQKTGGNLGEALGNLSAVLRGRRMMREKIKALSSEAVSSAAVIACLPPGVGGLISMTQPKYLTVMFVDPRGHMLLAIAAIIMTIGVLVMRKMINFKF